MCKAGRRINLDQTAKCVVIIHKILKCKTIEQISKSLCIVQIYGLFGYRASELTPNRLMCAEVSVNCNRLSFISLY